jgi:hypothetical protein
MKRHVITTILLTLLVLIGICDVENSQASNANEVAAKMKLDSAQVMISMKRYDEAAVNVMDILEREGLSDAIRGRAFLMMGNIAFYTGDFKVAKLGYQWVLKLPGANSQDKVSAKQGLELAEDFEKLHPK